MLFKDDKAKEDMKKFSRRSDLTDEAKRAIWMAELFASYAEIEIDKTKDVYNSLKVAYKLVRQNIQKYSDFTFYFALTLLARYWFYDEAVMRFNREMTEETEVNNLLLINI